jgi:parvulin-like peptidyl-prolyl isomerase
LTAVQSGSQSSTIVVSQSDVDQLVGTFERTWQRPPTEEERNHLVESFVRDEIYFREAVAAGLDREDSVIRRRMRLKMEYIFEDIAAQDEPTDADLQMFFEKNSEQYLLDPQIAFRHVYINVDKRGKSAEADARQILDKIREGTDPDKVGDPFPLESEIRLSPLWSIKKQMGEEFGKNLLELKPGRWQGPVRSGFGMHLVFITKRIGNRLPGLKEVRELVKRDLMAVRQKELKDAAYARLRERYIIVVEKPQAASSPAVAEAGMKTVMR